MSSRIPSVSSGDLKKRRQSLKRQRKVKTWQSLWRSILVTGMTAGLFWVITRPNWVIREGSQIDIEGNQFLSEEAIFSLISVPYPQSILQFEPQQLSKQLEATGPIAEATVTRHLLPPTIMIKVKERKPVAITNQPIPTIMPVVSRQSELGFIDAQGIWMSQKSYLQLQNHLKLPTLKVIGFKEQYQEMWKDLYPLISKSSIKILELDWQDPHNLILHTELGKVHIGSYTAQFPKQLTILAQLRELPTQIETSTIAYIDLRNPDTPSIQLIEGKTKTLDASGQQEQKMASASSLSE